MFYSQEIDGVVSLNIPVRNSLTFNRYAINPTFSFVREQTKYISLYNKREWVQFENAPLTYLASYSGRFGENIGAGLGVFQQNYGVLTTFGANANFAYNVQLAAENNLTFGLNIGAYKSGINTGNVISNFDDPSLQNVPENFLLSINPGINYGTDLFDFGVSINNLVLYNFESSSVINDNPQQGIQAHVMYTGYMTNSRGFFDESKFTTLLKSEFQKDNTIVSATAMLTVPKGIWAQAGYNTSFGISAGVGLNITPEIAIEYNIEKGTGALTNFGNTYSHEITLAYRFKNNNRYDYSSGDEVGSLLTSEKKKTPTVAKIDKEKAEANRKLAAERKVKAKEEADAQAKLAAQEKAKQEAEAQARLLEEQKAKEEGDAQAKLAAAEKAKQEAEAEARILEEQKAKEEADARAKLAAEEKAKQEAENQARLLAEQKAKEEADARAKMAVAEKAKQEAETQARLLEEQKAKEEAEAQARLIEEQKAKEEADKQAKLLEEQKAKETAAAEDKLAAEQNLIANPEDELGKTMYKITQQTENSKVTQSDLLNEFDAIVEIKNKDLKDLKEENDLSEKGIVVGPKPFKSITAENNKLASIKSELDNVIKNRNDKIEELKRLYDDKFEADTITNDVVYLFYQKTLKRLESEQLSAIEIKSNLETRLADIKVATEFERKRRIKRATFDNEEERYNNDRAALLNMQRTTPLVDRPYTIEDFDFGEEQSNNIQILKNVDNVEEGFYMIIAVHNDIEKRNDFVKKVIGSGRMDVDFFYDVKTSKYFIYYDKYGSISEATEALKSKGSKTYNTKMSIVKIEN